MKHCQSLKKAIAFCLMWVFVLSACGGMAAESPAMQTLDLSAPGLRIGVESGSVQEQLVQALYPQAEILYMDKFSGYTAVAQEKLDCFVFDKKQMEIAVANGLTGVRVLAQTFGPRTDIALGISGVSPIPQLEERVNQLLSALRDDGTLDDMYNRWVVQGSRVMPQIVLSSSPAYHLTVGTTGVVEPYSFYAGTELTGYDIELSYRLAAALNASLSFEIYDYGSIVEAARSGKVDIIAANLQVTPERREALTFSTPLYQEENGILVRDEASQSTQAPAAVRWQDYNGKRIGVLTGPLMEDTAAAFFPSSEYLLFDSYPDCAAALLAGKINAFLGDEPGMKSLHAEIPQIDYIHDRLTENNYSFAFRKDDPQSAALCAELNAFLAECWADGTIQELEDIWLGVDEARKVVDLAGLTGENGTVRVVTTSTDMPWSYIKDGQNVGYDIDLVVRFCRSRGYALELGDVDFAGRIPAIQSGKYDFTTDMNVTPEREEQVLFSNPTSQGGIVLAIPASDLAQAASSGEGSMPESADVLADKRIGVMTGTMHDSLVTQRLPDAQIVYFNTIADMLDALKAGKIDAMVRPQSGALFISYQEENITWLNEQLTDAKVGFAFPKLAEGAALRERFSAYIRTLRASGELETMRTKWFSKDEYLKTMLYYSTLPATNGTLRLATTGTQMPFTYVRDNTVVGFEIELAARFCAENGYALRVEQMNFDGILATVQAGKCDFACACLAVTEERQESVDFAEPHFADSVVFVVLKNAAGQKDSFLSSVWASFEKTFIRENRWQLFLRGIGTTLLITALSIFLGTMVGFAVYLACRGGNRFVNLLARFFVWLVQGMPVVVLLMILYYIIFAKSSMNGTAVAVVAFTLIFAAAMFGMLRTGVGAVSKGQTEAAYALGYGSTRTFFRVILPQAVPHFLPSYKGQITAIIKATAVVGYISVQDLTKMGDIVRGRTYEAFFPLIAVAVIYFILAALLKMLVGRIEVCINPRRRKKEQILKGVKTHD